MNANRSLPVVGVSARAQGPARWVWHLAFRVTQWAARLSPPAFRERLAEEWLADLAERPGVLSGLSFSLGCCWAATAIEGYPPAEPAWEALTAAGPAPGNRCRSPKRSATRPAALRAHGAPAMSDINITPLIDVMLVLLVTLIVSLPAMTHAVNMNLAQGGRAQERPPAVIDLDIDFDGTVVWNGTALPGMEQLESYLRLEAKKQPQPRLALRPDARARYAVVAQVLAAAQRNRLETVSFANTAEFGSQKEN